MAFLSHNHEEADTQIPLHILFSIEYNALIRLALHFDVYPVDSDILLLLDLVYHYPETIKPSISIILHKGRGKLKKSVDIKDPVVESFALLGSIPSSHFKLVGENLHEDL